MPVVRWYAVHPNGHTAGLNEKRLSGKTESQPLGRHSVFRLFGRKEGYRAEARNVVVTIVVIDELEPPDDVGRGTAVVKLVEPTRDQLSMHAALW